MARRIDDPKRALALARTIASDIALYNEAKLAGKLDRAALLKALEPEIEQGRQYFDQRVGPDIPVDELYDRAIDEVLAPQRSRKTSKKRRPESVG